MQTQKEITETYNKVAANYAAHYINELDGKPLDKLLLRYFAEENKNKGAMLDIGCGPGQTTKFLTYSGCQDITGTDISPAMIENAKSINPALNFEVADVLNLPYADNTFGAAVAFYAIVNFDYPAIKKALSEINRVLKSGGQFLFSFHTGNQMVHLDELLEEQVNIDFYFLDTERVVDLLKETGFNVIDTLIRFPYKQEFQSKRAYILAEKITA